MSETKNTFGLANSSVVYIIGAMALLEACVFLILYYLVLVDLDILRELFVEILWIHLRGNAIRRVIFMCFGIQGLRFMFALILILGRLKGSLQITVVFCCLTLILIVGNTATGIFLVQNYLSKPLAIASFLVIAMHIAYIVVCLKIYRQEQIFKINESETSNIPEYQVQYISRTRVPVQLQREFPAEAIPRTPDATPVQTPDQIENRFPLLTPIDTRTVIEHVHDSPQPVCTGQYECFNPHTSQSDVFSLAVEPPPNYDEEETRQSQAVDTKQYLEDLPPKVYI